MPKKPQKYSASIILIKNSKVGTIFALFDLEVARKFWDQENIRIGELINCCNEIISVRHTPGTEIAKNSDFGTYLPDFDTNGSQKEWSSKNIEKFCSQLDPPDFSAFFGDLRFPPIWHIFSKICAIWVEIWDHQKMQKNQADPAGSKTFQYFWSFTLSETHLCQNRANMSQNHCFLRFLCLVCVAHWWSHYNN